MRGTPDEREQRVKRLESITKEEMLRTAELYLDHLPVIRAALYRFTRNAADVEELSQEVYVRFATGIVPAQPRSIRAFILTITRNVALDWLRHRKIVPIDLMGDLEGLEEVIDGNPQAEDIINSHQELVILAEAAVTLPPLCRRAFTLRKVYGFSQKEIAEAMNISVNTVEQHLAKAARLLTLALFGFYRKIPKRGWKDDSE